MDSHSASLIMKTYRTRREIEIILAHLICCTASFSPQDCDVAGRRMTINQAFYFLQLKKKSLPANSSDFNREAISFITICAMFSLSEQAH